ncbi:MAG: hypothetical protein ACAI44_02445 [Candidatus Sericytochromatia bacterium]
MKRSHRFLLGAGLAGYSTLLGACGSSRDLAPEAPPEIPVVTASSSADELAAALPRILAGLEDIKQEIKALEITRSGGTVPAPKPSASTKPGPVATPRPGSSPSPSSVPSSPPADAKTKGHDELMAVMNKIRQAPFVVLTAEKHEKNLTSGKVTYNKVRMTSRQPNLVKVEILKSSSGSDGVTALYTSGVGNIIKVKKFFIKLDLPKNDERVTSNNGYTADVIDLFGVSKRMSAGYEAELVGTTQLNGTTLNVLKVSTSGSNTLDARIGYEYLGYEPETHAIRLWEAYDKNGSKDPYYRMVLNEISYPASVPESVFNL